MWRFTSMYPLSKQPPMTPLSDIVYERRAIDMAIVAYCAEEVRRQDDTPWHVYRMLDAWFFAYEQKINGLALTHSLIREIGKRVDEVNYNGYRAYDIWIGGERRGYESIHADLTNLIDQWYNGAITDADEWYYRYELIHPWGDGNGRSGKILFNWLNDTLDNPVWPTDHFGGISNP